MRRLALLPLNAYAMPIRYVIFDMDGVLCQSEPFIAEAACRMFAETYGVRVAPEEFVPFVGAGEDRYLSGVAEKHGISLTLPRDKERTYELYLEVIRGRLKPVPGLHDFLRFARRFTCQLAIATSADLVKLEGNLRELGLARTDFDAVVTGDRVARKKPAPDIFLETMKELRAPSGLCLVIEDAVLGIQAAKSAGCRALGLTTSFSADALRAAGADWTAPDFLSLSKDLLSEFKNEDALVSSRPGAS